MRVGMGYDSHRMGPDRPLILGGIHVPYELGLIGHSDADVLIHAVVDALLGAAGLGDIGILFPDSDPQYKDRSSAYFLETVGGMLSKHGFSILNIDATVIAQAPKLSPHFPRMIARIAEILKIASSQIQIKAKTSEGMGLIGQGEGMASFAVALVQEKT